MENESKMFLKVVAGVEDGPFGVVPVYGYAPTSPEELEERDIFVLESRLSGNKLYVEEYMVIPRGKISDERRVDEMVYTAKEIALGYISGDHNITDNIFEAKGKGVSFMEAFEALQTGEKDIICELNNGQTKYLYDYEGDYMFDEEEIAQGVWFIVEREGE